MIGSCQFREPAARFEILSLELTVMHFYDVSKILLLISEENNRMNVRWHAFCGTLLILTTSDKIVCCLL
jgi:hypothetical protein